MMMMRRSSADSAGRGRVDTVQVEILLAHRTSSTYTAYGEALVSHRVVHRSGNRSVWHHAL